MTQHPDPATRGRRSGGPWASGDFGESVGPESPDRYLSVPPDDRRQTGTTPGTARVVRTLVVRDAAGRVVSVTKVAPDAMFGVGVKPPPGHTVTEVEAGTLAEDPFGAGGPGERPGVRGQT